MELLMSRVRVEPLGIEFEARTGETVMAAASRAGYQWPTVCGGQGACRTCFFAVLSASTGLDAPGRWEQEGLAQLMLPSGSGRIRLACQARVLGDVTVEKRGVRPS